jgi:hypothetical protein
MLSLSKHRGRAFAHVLRQAQHDCAIVGVRKICIYAKTPSLGKGAAACEVAGRGYLHQYLSPKPLPAPSRWEGIAHIHRFFVFRTPVVTTPTTAKLSLSS